MAHLYATFADAALAEKAAGALLDYGVRKEDLSLVANDSRGRTVETAGANVGHATQSVGDRLGQAGDRIAGAVTGAVGATSTAAGYDAGASQRAGMADVRADQASTGASGYGTTGGAQAGGSTEVAATHGISTTTPEDAGQGAVKGTEIGLGLGILAGLASLLVPGVGLVVGGGALATALGGAALAAGAGAVAGGVTGYLKDQGVPGDAVQHYQGAVENGGAILSINIPSGNVDQAGAEQVLAKYNASNVNAY